MSKFRILTHCLAFRLYGEDADRMFQNAAHIILAI